jgi:hypothetical protein
MSASAPAGARREPRQYISLRLVIVVSARP